MSYYILTIYDQELTEDTIQQISGLCSDADVKPMLGRPNALIGGGYHGNYNLQNPYHCYYIMSETIDAQLFLLEPRPNYVGIFDDPSEFSCLLMAGLCNQLEEMIDDIKDHGMGLNDIFEKIFNHKSNFNDNAAKAHLKDLKRGLSLAKRLHKQFYKEHQIPVPEKLAVA